MDVDCRLKNKAKLPPGKTIKINFINLSACEEWFYVKVEQPYQGNKLSIGVIIGIAAGALAIITTVVCLIIRNKNKKLN